MVYDIEKANAVNYDRVEIEGRLTFENDTAKEYELKANMIIAYPGELFIGNETHHYGAKAQLTLLGTPNMEGYAYNNDAIAGNKILFVAGKLVVHGSDKFASIASPNPIYTHLKAPAAKGQNKISVVSTTGWAVDDEIVIAPTSYDYKQTEKRKITAINTSTGEVTLDSNLEHPHYGAAAAESYTVGTETLNYDLRAEVGHLTRNVKIQGDGGRWGGQIVVVDFVDSNNTNFQGYTFLKNVEIRHMSQYDTSRAALRLEKAGTTADSLGSRVDRCSIWGSSAWAVALNNAGNFTFVDNVVYDTHRNAYKVERITKMTMQRNLFLENDEREFDKSIMLKDH